MIEESVGFAIATTVQLVPFHRALYGTSLLPLRYVPVARQNVTLGHATSVKYASVPVDGFGAGTRDQLAPFHRSINGASWGKVIAPTAKHFDALAHARSSSRELDAAGV